MTIYRYSSKPSMFVIRSSTSINIHRYTYGKGVAGKAKVTLEHPWHHWNPVSRPIIVNDAGDAVQVEQERVIERTVKLNNMGEATIVFTNQELKDKKLIEDYGGSSVKIVATVTEDLTDIARNGTAQVFGHQLARQFCSRLLHIDMTSS